MIAVAFSRPRGESPVGRKALVAGGAILFAALILSYSRGSLLNLLVALAVLTWRNRARIRLWRVAAFTASAAFLTWQVFPRFAQAYWQRASASAEFFFSATEGVLSGRLASWRALFGWVEAHPWQAYFGIGYKTLPYTDYLGAPLVAATTRISACWSKPASPDWLHCSYFTGRSCGLRTAPRIP